MKLSAGSPALTKAARPSSSSRAAITQAEGWNTLTFALLAGYLTLILLSFQSYGITYDEPLHAEYGERILRWFTTGFRDRGALDFWVLGYYGGFFDILQQLAAKVSPLGLFETRHLVTALFALLAAFIASRLGKLLGGPLAGFLSAIFLILMPRFYGHGFNNPVDLPFATLFLASLYLLVVLLRSLPRPPIRLLILYGVVIGMALGIRVGAVLLVGYTALGFFLWLVFSSLDTFRKSGLRGIVAPVRGLLVSFVTICAAAYLSMLAWWPAAQANPLRQPVRALRFSTSFEYPFNVLFDGKKILNTELPRYYLSKWFSITLPEFFFIALLAGLVLLSVRVIAQRQQFLLRLKDPTNQGILIVITAAVFPFIYTALTVPVDYDEIRHFLFIVPLLAILAGLSIAKALEALQSFPVKAALAAALSISVLLTAVDMVRLHPNQYIYFNRLFGGGVASAARLYDTDYWGNSMKEGVEWITHHSPAATQDHKLKVASCLYSTSTSYYLPTDRFEYIGSFHDGQPISGHPDLFLASPRWECDKKLPGTVIHTVTRMGAPLLYVVQVDPAVQ